MSKAQGIAQSANQGNFKNRIINGAMMIDQRNAGASVAVTGVGQYSVDRFRADIFSSATGRFSIQQSSVAPVGFVNSLLVTVTTANASPTADFGYSVQQIIEGFNISDFGWGTANAQPVTLSFWVRSSVTGTFPLVIQNSDADRAFGGQYTISSANTWEYKTVAISGITSGTWLTTNGIGARVLFGLGGGSNRTISTGFQSVGSFQTQTNVTGSTNLLATNGATFQLTGVQLEKGSTATSFDYRPYGTELQLAQRYYQVFYPAGQELIYNEGNTASAKFWQLYLPVPMRASPTATYSSGMAGGSVIGLSGTISSLSLTSASVNRLSTRVTMSTNTGTANLIYHCDSFVGDSVGLDSEL
jgi:hypothetical protein